MPPWPPPPRLPAVGDWVVVDPRSGSGPPWVVAVVLDRRSALTRGVGEDARDGQVMAANVDVVAVVTGLDRPLNLRRLERELVLAWDSGAHPLIVLNKAGWNRPATRAPGPQGAGGTGERSSPTVATSRRRGPREAKLCHLAVWTTGI